ncbi:hypothetical protein ABLE94_24445 [Gordonia sp. VNK1]|uniref:hypothetical protein n=1 Tax=Gordonia oleivorans TaxID=3156618 RepID=UPI0032B596F3
MPIPALTSTPVNAPVITIPQVSSPLYPCDCGCELTDDDVLEFLDSDDDWVSHQKVRAVTQHILDLREVCSFFDDHVNRSVKKFTPIALRYRPAMAAKAVREGANTWHGCPEELCSQTDSEPQSQDGKRE